jgi:hypothetical protein
MANGFPAIIIPPVCSSKVKCTPSCPFFVSTNGGCGVETSLDVLIHNSNFLWSGVASLIYDAPLDSNALFLLNMNNVDQIDNDHSHIVCVDDVHPIDVQVPCCSNPTIQMLSVEEVSGKCMLQSS